MRKEKLEFCRDFPTQKKAYEYVKARTNKEHRYQVIEEWDNGSRIWNVFKKVIGEIENV